MEEDGELVSACLKDTGANHYPPPSPLNPELTCCHHLCLEVLPKALFGGNWCKSDKKMENNLLISDAHLPRAHIVYGTLSIIVCEIIECS